MAAIFIVQPEQQSDISIIYADMEQNTHSIHRGHNLLQDIKKK